eukprot:TRINITY_DN40028_c0_g1_i1.p1 TRINITY_DN40028_c0_g1~~TRINITY_DN40028_c0_g1_i1.p1  ORF type:complete len:115 (+),score=43.27 TRINITY_DN40028_c0_g1_i1:32-376(+)
MYYFFFVNDTATTEIQTRSIVGSVRCVQETAVDISTDTEDLAEKMEKFVEDYNDMMEYVYGILNEEPATDEELEAAEDIESLTELQKKGILKNCLLYTSPSPRDLSTSRMPSSA